MTRLFIFVGTVLFLCATTACLFSPIKTDATFTNAGQDQWEYEDGEIKIQFSHSDQHFQWRIKNKRLLNLTINQQDIALNLEGDPTAYTLWGKPRATEPNINPLKLAPNAYLTLRYPLQYNTPFMPYPVEKKLAVSFKAQWEDRAFAYKLQIPKKPSRKKLDPE